MSDLLGGNQPAGLSTARPQNGGSRPVPGAGGTTSAEIPRYRTPTEIVAARRAREARRAEQEAERTRQLQEEEMRRRQQEETAGVEGDSSRRPTAGRPDTQTGATYIGSSGAPIPASSRRQETISAAPQAQPRPSGSQQQAGDVPGHARISSNTQRNRTEAYDQLNIPATAQPEAQPSSSNNPQPAAPAPQQPRIGFPHAFERWENLSSQWEGLTSYWIRRLQENTNELDGKPIDQQMSRQISDLSAAGANLFHAVVELQRLRASSERKFQRWFFETRNEQEQAAERQAELERQLRAEREARDQGSIDAVRAEKTKAEEMLREMRRELQISKEEARRAWEELGRREQEERERTIALRSGEPTLIGGVQVVPMQGLTSRQTSTVQRPQTRDGPYPGGPGPTLLGGQSERGNLPPPSRSQTTTTSLDSPDEEHRQFTYQPQGTSPPTTDPFSETTAQLRREPDAQFYTTPPRPTQPSTSSAAIAAARAATTTAHPSTTNGNHHAQQFYQQPDPQTTIHQPLSAMPTTAAPRPNTAQSSQRSYIPSTTGSSFGEHDEEYHINPDGSYTLDSHGRRIPYNQPIASDPEDVGDLDEEEDDDYASDIARERMYAQQYSSTPARTGQTASQQSALPVPSSSSPSQAPRTRTAQPTALPTIQQGQVSSSTSRPSQPGSATTPSPQEPADYEGAAYGRGWDTVNPRVYPHPTRLSDILEEQTSRTSPSRESYGGGGAVGR